MGCANRSYLRPLVERTPPSALGAVGHRRSPNPGWPVPGRLLEPRAGMTAVGASAAVVAVAGPGSGSDELTGLADMPDVTEPAGHDLSAVPSQHAWRLRFWHGAQLQMRMPTTAADAVRALTASAVPAAQTAPPAQMSLVALALMVSAQGRCRSARTNLLTTNHPPRQHHQ